MFFRMVHPLMHESVWYNKFRFDDAEKMYQESIAKGTNSVHWFWYYFFFKYKLLLCDVLLAIMAFSWCYLSLSTSLSIYTYTFKGWPWSSLNAYFISSMWSLTFNFYHTEKSVVLIAVSKFRLLYGSCLSSAVKEIFH